MLRRAPVATLFIAYGIGLGAHRAGVELGGIILASCILVLGAFGLGVGRWTPLVLMGTLVTACGWCGAQLAVTPKQEFVSPCPVDSTLWQARVLEAGPADSSAEIWRARVELIRCVYVGRWWEIPVSMKRPAFWTKVGGTLLSAGDEVQGVIRIRRSIGRQHFWVSQENTQNRYRFRAPYDMAVSRLGWFSRWGGTRLHARISSLIGNNLSPKLAGVALALALGQRQAVSKDLRRKWSDSGIAHLLAISGLHIGLIGCFAWWALSRILILVPGFAARFCVRSVASLCTCCSLILFCLWVGAPVSAMRATLMSVFALVGHLYGGRLLSWNAYCGAALVLLIYSPALLENYGFWLSFVSTGILLFNLRENSDQGALWWWRWLRRSLEISFLTGLATAPILAMCFGKISLISPITNLFAVPLTAFVMVPSIFIYSLFLYWELPGSEPIRIILESVYFLVDWGIELLLKIPWSVWKISPHGLVWLTLGGISWLAIWKCRPRVLKVALFIGGLFCLMVGAELADKRDVIESFQFASDELGIIFPYVGQGDGAVIRLPNGQVMVIDAGGAWGHGDFDPGREVMGRVLRALDATVIDIAVLTHAHPDHIQGFIYLAQAYKIRELWYHGDDEHPMIRQIIKKVLEKGGVVKAVSQLPTSICLGEVTIQPLHPRPIQTEDLYYSELNENENSVVLHLNYRGRTALFTGDVEYTTESEWGIHWPKAEILKVPHHGSKTSSSEAFLRTIDPKVGIISVGEQNRFKLPAAKITRRYHKRGVRIMRTDRDGDIVARTDGGAWDFATANQYLREIAPFPE